MQQDVHVEKLKQGRPDPEEEQEEAADRV